MQNKARTLEFNHRLEITADRLSYRETTLLDIYGKRGYEHSDQNSLKRLS
jgi:hypothetical protein